MVVTCPCRVRSCCTCRRFSRYSPVLQWRIQDCPEGQADPGDTKYDFAIFSKHCVKLKANIVDNPLPSRSSSKTEYHPRFYHERTSWNVLRKTNQTKFEAGGTFWHNPTFQYTHGAYTNGIPIHALCNREGHMGMGHVYMLRGLFLAQRDEEKPNAIF